MAKAKSVDEYISSAPSRLRGKLEEMRSVIRETAPAAKESISYKIPFYDYKGRMVWFGLQSTHLGLYIRPPIIQNHRNLLKRYQTTKSSVHFPLDENLPVPLIKKLVKAAMRMNEEEERKRHSRRGGDHTHGSR
jgi:uncharacterized protein YdhG (YjbR/CyaY superfamily)